MTRAEKSSSKAQSALAHLNKTRGLLYDYSLIEFANLTTLGDAVKIVCRVHEEIFTQRLARHMEGLHGCSLCQKERKQKRRVDFKEFVRRAQNVHGNKYLYNEKSYTVMNKPTLITCLIHGDFSQVPYKHYGGQHCPDCASESRKLALQKPLAGRSLGEVSKVAVLNWAPSNEFTPFQLSYKSKVKVNWLCKECKYQWEDSIQVTVNRLGCPQCGFGEEILELEFAGQDLESWALINKPALLLEFSSSNEIKLCDLGYRSIQRVYWSCSKNPNHPEWRTSVKSRTLKDRGCQYCYESHGERKIDEWLRAKQIDFVREFSPKTLFNPETGRRLRYDFALEEERVLIEFDGVYHFKPIVGRKIRSSEQANEQLQNLQDRDRVKNRWASENGWTLYRISYLEDLYKRLDYIFKL